MALRDVFTRISGRATRVDPADGWISRTPVTTINGATGAQNLDCSLSDAFVVSAPTGNLTLSITNAPSSAIARTIAIKFVQHGTTARTVTWPSSFKWPGGTAHVVSTGLGAVDVVVATTMDGGTSWQANGSKAYA